MESKNHNLISIIVPVYNTEKYLIRCIESIRNQTYQNIEILLINDGSTDGSSGICDREGLVDDRIHVYHQKNHGPAYARNYGIKKAAGTYVICVDSDDTMHPDMLEKMMNGIEKNEAEMAVCSFTFKTEDGIDMSWYTPDFGNTKVVDRDAAIRMFLTTKNIEGFSWNKLIKRDIIVDHENWLDETKDAYEDMENTFNNLMSVSRVYLLNEALYNYYQYSDSTVHSTSLDKEKAYIDSIQKIRKLALENGFDEGNYYYVLRLIQQYYELMKNRELRKQEWWKSLQEQYRHEMHDFGRKEVLREIYKGYESPMKNWAKANIVFQSVHR